MTSTITILVPVHQQAAFLPRALGCALGQTMADWELLVLDDGSRDDPAGAVARTTADRRIAVHRTEDNRGLGAACNRGLELTRGDLVAYLPADDLWDRNHLQRLLDVIQATGAVLAHSGMRHSAGVALDRLPEHGLQLVQVMHRRTAHRWTERDELVTDDLERTFFDRLPGPRASTGAVTCTWQAHPGQRHRAIRERHDGGLNVFRRRYRVPHPLRFASRDGPAVDEVTLYQPFREQRTVRSPDGLRVLLVGELAFHPERVVQLAARGHELFGLWINDPLGPHTVGPLPVGHVSDIDGDDPVAVARQLAPDVIYAQQNWRAVPLAHHLLEADVAPLVWHFKESPQRCLARGTWPQLAELVQHAHACLVASDVERDWFAAALPGVPPADVVDGDLPSARWGQGPASPRLSDEDGARHLAVIGRPLGLDARFVATLASADVHLHLHGLVDAPGPSGRWRTWLQEARTAAPDHLHVHTHVPPDRWRQDLSRYDAALLHRTTSHNFGDVRTATWDDCNLPARIATCAAAGLPLVAPAQPGHRVAVQDLVEATGAGLLDHGPDDLVDRLRSDQLAAARTAMERARQHFTFDHHADHVDAVLRKAAR